VDEFAQELRKLHSLVLRMPTLKLKKLARWFLLTSSSRDYGQNSRRGGWDGGNHGRTRVKGPFRRGQGKGVGGSEDTSIKATTGDQQLHGAHFNGESDHSPHVDYNFYHYYFP
jgi:hypothetical protein